MILKKCVLPTWNDIEEAEQDEIDLQMPKDIGEDSDCHEFTKVTLTGQPEKLPPDRRIKKKVRTLSMPFPQEKPYTIKDIYALPDRQRAELIDGKMHMMALPDRIHQKLVSRLSQLITNYIDSKHGTCEVYPAPFAVFLDKDDLNYVEPDISVICDKSKLTEQGCNGAPDWIIEITSPSSPQNDYGIKLFKQHTAGVREYWIVNPQKKSVMLYDLEHEKNSNQYGFEENVPVCIYEDLHICILDLI